MTTTLAPGNHATLWVCVDCLMWVANNEVPTYMSEDEVSDFVTDFNDSIPRNHVLTYGLVADEHNEQCPYHPDDPRDWHTHECMGCEVDPFSWRRCEACRRPNQAGERHAMTMISTHPPTPSANPFSKYSNR